MEDKTAYWMMIGMVSLLVISAGANVAQYKMTETGEKLICRSDGGWQMISEGDDAGKYQCVSGTSIRKQYCARTSDTMTGKKDYYCHVGALFLIENPTPAANNDDSVKQWRCDTNRCVEI